MSDSNSNQNNDTRDDSIDESRTPGLSKQVMARVIAVLLFVGVGSFAVAQSVYSNRNENTKETAKLTPTKTSDAKTGTSESDKAPQIAKKPVVTKSFVPSGQNPSTEKGNQTPANADKFPGSQPPPGRGINPAVTTKLGPPPTSPNLRSPSTNGFNPSSGSGSRQLTSTFGDSLKPSTTPPTRTPNSTREIANKNTNRFGSNLNDTAKESFSGSPRNAADSTQLVSHPIQSPSNSFGGSNGFEPPKNNNSTSSQNQDKGFAPSRFSNPKSPATGPASSNPLSAPGLRPSSNQETNLPKPSAQASFDTSRELRPIQSPSTTRQQPSMLPNLRDNKGSNLLDVAKIQAGSKPPTHSPSKGFPAVDMPLNTGNPALSQSPPQNPRDRFRAQPAKTDSPTSRMSTNGLPSFQPQTQPPTQTQLPTRNVSAPIRRPAFNSNNAINSQPATTPTNSSTFTKSTPGDRKLEGMQAPSITVEKIAPREIQLNAAADFQLVIKNTGRIMANHVQIHDEIPIGTEWVQSSPPPSNKSSGRVMWNLGAMKPGEEKRIQFKLRPTRPGEIGSVAHVTFSAQASMRTRVTKPMLSIQQTGKPKVLIGDTVLLNIVVKNDGDGAARNVVIQEDVPQQLIFNDGYKELEYEVGTLGPGQSKSIQLALKAAQIGRFRNVMVAHATGGLQAQHAIDMEVVAPKLKVSSSGPRRRFLRRNSTHEFSLENSGTAKATNVELIARLPKGLRFVSADNQAKYDANGHAVHWSLAELSPNLVAAVHVTTTPVEPGNQPIAFEAVADLGQKTNTSHDLTVEHLVDVFFDIDDVVDPIEVGSDTSYRVRILNQGTKTATNVMLSIDFPMGMQPTSVDGNVTAQVRGQQIVFSPIASINPGDEIKVIVHARGTSPGDHRVTMRLQTDGRESNVTKQESTRVYSDQ